MDFSLSGGRFTWSSNRSGATFCRLDRFLLSPGFMHEFLSVVQKVLPRLLSDHNIIALIDDEVNWVLNLSNFLTIGWK